MQSICLVQSTGARRPCPGNPALVRTLFEDPVHLCGLLPAWAADWPVRGRQTPGDGQTRSAGRCGCIAQQQPLSPGQRAACEPRATGTLGPSSHSSSRDTACAEQMRLPCLPAVGGGAQAPRLRGGPTSCPGRHPGVNARALELCQRPRQAPVAHRPRPACSTGPEDSVQVFLDRVADTCPQAEERRALPGCSSQTGACSCSCAEQSSRRRNLGVA